jgi:hypothetical protein
MQRGSHDNHRVFVERETNRKNARKRPLFVTLFLNRFFRAVSLRADATAQTAPSSSPFIGIPPSRDD